MTEAKDAIIRVIASGRRALKEFFGGLMGTPNYYRWFSRADCPQ
jgi:hypothetical protein